MSTIKEKKSTRGLQEISESRGTLYNIDPRKIEVVEGFNVRTDYGDMDGLKQSIKENGVKIPLQIHTKEGKVLLSSGHRRLKAVMDLIKEGHEIKSVPCVSEPKHYNDEQRVADLIIANDGKPLTPIEEALVVQRLTNFGWNPKQIAEKTGRTQAHVSNMLKLSSLPTDIQNSIRKGDFSATMVLEMARECGEKTELLKEKLEKAIDTATKAGKTKATKKHVKKEPSNEKSKVKKFDLARVIGVLDNLIKSYQKGNEEKMAKAIDEACILRDDINKVL